MSEGVAPLAAAAGLLRVDDPLLAERYRAGLAALGIRAGGPGAFHLDASGFSPEWAEALGDPLYLSGGALEAHGVVVAPGQLAAPIVHPGFGFAAEAWLRVASANAREIAELTLREPLLLEARAEGAPFAAPVELADPAAFELRLRTPSGLIEGQRRLAALQREFLASERLWLDDTFLAELAALADRVRGLPELAEGFEAVRPRLGPLCFTPAFGGAYRIEEPGASAAVATTTLLVAASGPDAAPARSRQDRRIELRRLDAESALELLERHGIARVDLNAVCEPPGERLRLRRGLALAACLAGEPDAAPEVLDERAVDQVLRGAAARLSPGQRDLEQATRDWTAGRTGSDGDSLAPEARLRLALPTSRRPEVRRFVRHLQAFLAPADLGFALAHAPDLFFARLLGVPAPLRGRLAAWLQREPCMAERAQRA